MATARAELEALLRTRKLDVTLTSSAAWSPADEERVAATGWPDLDDPLGGGMRRGHLSEIVGERSAGCTTLWLAMAAAATARGEVVAFIDTHDRFDPMSAEAAGVDLSRLLWVRESGQADRALKAMNLVLQAGGFGLVAFDLSDVRGPALRQFPHTTWMRIARIVEGSLTVAVLIGAEHIARSPGGATIVLERGSAPGSAEWAGNNARNRRLQGLTIRPRVISMRSMGTMGAAARGTRLCTTAG
jgi:hypothetical protein